MRVYFYPHSYLRDRHLDTIRHWPHGEAVNPEIAQQRTGNQVSKETATADKPIRSWKTILPLVNIKKRPASAPNGTVVYVWGALMLTGPFILDLDNPWALTGYNLRALSLYKPLLKSVLLSDRCVEIRCMSDACRRSLREIFGDRVYQKARVHYPRLVVPSIEAINIGNTIRFLFIGTQFEIKGGQALLRSFSAAVATRPSIQLSIVTHMPKHLMIEASHIPNVTVYSAHYSRTQIEETFLRNHDILVLPTYVESFGMVVLEAIAHGLAVISTDVYALGEMVIDQWNGRLLSPPVRIWDGVLPTALQEDLSQVKQYVRSVDTSTFEIQLTKAMLELSANTDQLIRYRQNSRQHYERHFLATEAT